MRGRRLYQEIARTAADNAAAFLQDAKSAFRRRNIGHSCSLGILAIEESAKAIIYKQAADGIVRFVKRKPNNVSTYSERDLLDHKFKHGSVATLMMGAIEYYPFVVALKSTRRKQFTREHAETLLHDAFTRQLVQRAELSRGGKSTRDLMSLFQTIAKFNDLKNGGLYVGREGASVSRPNEFVKVDVKIVGELALLLVKTAEHTVSTTFSVHRRRVLAEHLRLVAAQTRRVKKLAPKPGRSTSDKA
ncbi:MAG: AbiV family abortive infection protein [Thermoplasmata archaeon]